jgi:predicted molibdopterin-dependent oxidoreductase YjgC
MNIEDYQDVFEPFDKLVSVEICGERRDVPENNTLLRCFQFLSPETVSYGDFCWNGDCLNCRVWLENGEREKAVISCRTKIEKGMKIMRLSGEIRKVVNGK